MCCYSYVVIIGVVVWSCCVYFVFFFFFKQKTAYEMRISDWSSDVCSSDLAVHRRDSGVWVEESVRLGVGPRSDEVADDVDKVEIGRASCRERVCQYV